MNEKLTLAVLKLLRPLIRVLLRNGVPFGAFADLARWVYVDLALNEFGIEGRKSSDSHASIVTGLTRKEVARLRSLDYPQDRGAAEKYNRAARVITGWVRDRRFTDAKGNPRDLPFDKDKASLTDKGSFTELVREFSGDIPARAILDELLHVGAITLTEDQKVRLVNRAYVPLTGEEEKLNILGTDVADLIHTIDCNLRSCPGAPMFQRKVSYDNLPVEAVPDFKKLSSRYGQKLLERLDRELSRWDRDINPTAKGTGRMRAGMGVYYFEEDMSEALPDEKKGKGK